ncbi:MAG: hypothetical protein JNK53_08735, partial [Phycisphaerae bacterium]|nr:hypothetical protein [Phycisphaerae bacterium]
MTDAPNPLRRTAWTAAVMLASASLAVGCVRTVLQGEDPAVRRPTATGDASRDVLVINIPWMEAPIPRLLLGDRPVVAERVSARTSEAKTSYFLRTTIGTEAELEITTQYPSPDV